jgi:signal transduction histidine kinase
VKRALTIRGRLILIIFVGALVPLLVALTLVAANEIRRYRQAVVSESALLAAIVSDYAAVDMAFEDRPEAQKTLETLAKRQDVLYAALYDVAGERFAAYRNPGIEEAAIPDRISVRSSSGASVSGDHIDVNEVVADDVARYGTLHLQVSTAAVRERTRTYLFIAGGATAGIALLALVLAVVLQRSIARPILQLAQVAKAVAENHDYSVRADEHRDDEIGTLAAGFNAMLTEVDRRQREAEQAIQVRDEFLSIASHELNTPLTSLKLSLQNLQLAKEGAVFDEQQRRFVYLAARQSDRLERLVSELLNVTRLQQAKVVPNLEDVDLGELIREVAERFAPEFARSETRLDVTATEPIVGRWDRSRLDQVVTNLLTNALKFGEGKPIEIEAAVVEGRARIVVRDHGRGIPPDRIDRIFDAYERAVSTASFGGLGLGLFIARRLVEMHGGTLRVESVFGEGATFTVELPLAGPGA